MRVFLKDKEVNILPLNQVMEEPQLELSRKEVLGWEAKLRKPVPLSHPWKAGYHARERRKMV